MLKFRCMLKHQVLFGLSFRTGPATLKLGLLANSSGFGLVLGPKPPAARQKSRFALAWAAHNGQAAWEGFWVS